MQRNATVRPFRPAVIAVLVCLYLGYENGRVFAQILPPADDSGLLHEAILGVLPAQANVPAARAQKGVRCSRVKARSNSDTIWLDGLTLVTKISHHRSGAVSALFRFKNGAEREASIIYPKPHSLRDGGLAARKERLDLGDLTQSGVLKLSRLRVAPAKGLRRVSIRLTPPDAVVWN